VGEERLIQFRKYDDVMVMLSSKTLYKILQDRKETIIRCEESDLQSLNDHCGSGATPIANTGSAILARL